ncbi:MAG: hypothetical protein ACE3L7_32915 [Candidatus Pristimantibacillus sp.]
MPLDERSEKYLEIERKNMGLVGSNGGHYGIEDILKKRELFEKSALKEIRRYAGFYGLSDLVIYSYNVGNGISYCAELGYQTSIDDYNVETHIFTQIPSDEDVTLVRLMDEFELDLRLTRNGVQAEYRCWECGRNSHWVDIHGKFKDKVEKLREGYCGC